eukprot:gb/GEZN01006096.1/.p1 GENE.gb/GEZN01006096.1/~~gb/GEZN01006096.1/.p1  ORF type:complete len:489 (-),score=35.87 gb/GEZN01006096.1/:151-1617(-)
MSDWQSTKVGKRPPSSLQHVEKSMVRGVRPGSNAWALRLGGKLQLRRAVSGPPGSHRRPSRSSSREPPGLHRRPSRSSSRERPRCSPTQPRPLEISTADPLSVPEHTQSLVRPVGQENINGCRSKRKKRRRRRKSSLRQLTVSTFSTGGSVSLSSNSLGQDRAHLESDELSADVRSALSPQDGNHRVPQTLEAAMEEKVKANQPIPIKYLRTFSDLLVYSKTKPRFIGVDIDETLIMTEKSPSWLLTHFGVAMFQQYLSKRFSDFQTKNRWCRQLEKCLKAKRTVEGSTTVEVIRKLQESGCWVFGVTARYSEMAKATEMTLSDLGINLAVSSPFPAASIRDPVTDTACVNGIIYCSALSKGVIVDRIFQTVVFVDDIPEQNQPTEMRDVSDAVGFVFVDDSEIQLQTLQQFQCAQVQGLPVECYLYKPPILDDDSFLPPEELAVDRGKILMKQMIHFVDTGNILSNVEARALLRESSDSPTPRDSTS